MVVWLIRKLNKSKGKDVDSGQPKCTAQAYLGQYFFTWLFYRENPLLQTWCLCYCRHGWQRYAKTPTFCNIWAITKYISFKLKVWSL